MPVPGERYGSASRTSSTKSRSGPSSSTRLRVTIARPRCHVISTVNTTAAIVSGNQPPCTIFGMLAAKKDRSTVRKKTAPSAVSHAGLRHSIRTTTKKRSVSMASVPVTAIPYAEARFCDEPKPMTSATTAANSTRLIPGA